MSNASIRSLLFAIALLTTPCFAAASCLAGIQETIASQSLPTLELRAACAVEAKDWYSRNSWIQWVFGGVGATVVGHWLSSRRHQHRNEIERQQQQNEIHALKKQVESLSASKNSSLEIPSDIAFSSTLLRTPSLEELGIPAPFAYLAHIETHAKYGQWVNRGDLLVTYRLGFYYGKTPPPGLIRFFFGDRAQTISHELRAPVSGLVVDTRCVTCRTSDTHTHGVFFGVINKSYSTLPVILLPRNEPAWTNYELDGFRRQISATIREFWPLNLHNLGGGDGAYRRVRLADAIDHHGFWAYDTEHREQLARALAWAKSSSSENICPEWPTGEYAGYKTSHDTNLRDYVEELRAKNYALRGKLVHLVAGANT